MPRAGGWRSSVSADHFAAITTHPHAPLVHRAQGAGLAPLHHEGARLG